MSHQSRHKPCTDAATAAVGVSSGFGPGEHAGLPADPTAYRRAFRDRWGAFLRANFHNHLHVAVFFSVDERTSRNWWNDTTEPKGWAVSYARDQIPGARKALQEAA